MKDLKEETINLLKSRGVTIRDIAELTMFLQAKYHEDLTIEECEETIHSMLDKREVQYAILTCIAFDMAAEENKFIEPVNTLIKEDSILYGLDETLALGVTNLYGSIGFTNYGYIDKVKPGILKELDRKGKAKEMCTTFLDDVVGALAAAAASKIAHTKKQNFS
ncbi:MAG TPA: phosphatidylglycerophosphatase A [Tenericutes bacterium]|jgi:phosphatidylglycerophosphatase A|nr:phosphatidylglycerophosphatase A [Mycoplasmatota bacterium]